MSQQDPLDIDRWVSRIRAEYLEMPGLRLTKPQVRKLWSLDPMACDALLTVLVDAHVLAQTDRGAYVLDQRRPHD
jgi:hypothetical protein